jgi:hypothetical protein
MRFTYTTLLLELLMRTPSPLLSLTVFARKVVLLLDVVRLAPTP